jgi:hypothetical protein
VAAVGCAHGEAVCAQAQAVVTLVYIQAGPLGARIGAGCSSCSMFRMQHGLRPAYLEHVQPIR